MAWRRPQNLREWLRILFRHKKKFFFPAVAVMTLVMVGSLKIPREYQARAEFIREDTSMESVRVRGNSPVGYSAPLVIALRQDLLSRSSMERLVDDLKLTRDLEHTPEGELTRAARAQRDEMVRSLAGRFRIGFALKSPREDRVVVTYTGSNRELAPRAVNTLVENYIRATRAKLDDMLLRAQSFFDAEVSRYRRSVMDLTTAKLKMERDNPGLRPDDPMSLTNRLAELRARRDRIAEDLRRRQTEAEHLQAWIESQPEQISSRTNVLNPQREILIARLNQAKQSLDNEILLLRRRNTHPAVINLRRQIAELEKELAATEGEFVAQEFLEPNHERLKRVGDLELMRGGIVALENDHEETLTQIEEFERMERNFFVARNEYQKLLRELQEAEKQLGFWDNNLRATQIALAREVRSQGFRLTFSEPADDLAQLSKPTMPTIGLAAVVLGLGTGLLMILLAELLDHSFRSVEQAIDELKLPVLGTVNEITGTQQALRRRVLDWAVYPPLALLMVLALLLSVQLAYLSLEAPEEYNRLLRQPSRYFTSMISDAR